jgi:hypothetical protein
VAITSSLDMPSRMLCIRSPVTQADRVAMRVIVNASHSS